MAVYYGSNRDNMQSLYQEPIYLTHQQQQQQQQQASSSSAASFSENVRNEMVFIPPTTTDLQNVSGNGVSSNELSFHGQGLSLSLGTQIQTTPLVSVPSFHYHQYQNLSNQLGFVPNSAKETLPCEVDESAKSKEMFLDDSLTGHHQHQHQNMGYGVNIGFYNNYRYETSGFVSSVLRSRYLKPVQQLLDEVVSVRKDVNKNKGGDFNNGLSLDSKESELSANPSDSNGKSPELSSGERQDLQNKKNKLLTMVDEVDKRYNQYYHQMEALASSFEIIAGFGAAKPYTSVALNRISRHFRSLRDAIKGQVQVIKSKLGEKESSDEQGERIPRLRYLDQRLRQQRALHQQLGMVRPAWRPQRGLPENAVSILRAWLFEHFLHPYPKESEKIMLAKQTGLSKNQVANWFINARVRLWKPMIEEMYKEEFGDSESFLTKSSQEQNTTTSQFNNEEENNNNLTTNLVFSEQKQECVQDETQQEMNRSSGDYDDSLMNYNGFGLDDYRYIGGNQQDNRFSNSHQLHDFVV